MTREEITTLVQTIGDLMQVIKDANRRTKRRYTANSA
jgi:hypothetical protein